MPDVQQALGALRTGPATLTNADFTAAASRIGCEPEVIFAVNAVEAPRGPFDEFDRPTMLFERHLFHAYTGGIFDEAHPDLSNPVPGGYGLYSAQYARLCAAFSLDRTAALRATSWGAFQILGDNHAAAGFADPQSFVLAMWAFATNQLSAFTTFILASPRLVAAMQDKAWVAFAKVYNGPCYAVNKYDTKLQAAYEKAVGA